MGFLLSKRSLRLSCNEKSEMRYRNDYHRDEMHLMLETGSMEWKCPCCSAGGKLTWKLTQLQQRQEGILVVTRRASGLAILPPAPKLEYFLKPRRTFPLFLESISESIPEKHGGLFPSSLPSGGRRKKAVVCCDNCGLR
jgi:hypothetical protein